MVDGELQQIGTSRFKKASGHRSEKQKGKDRHGAA